MSFRAQAKTSKVCGPLSCLHPSATEHFSRLLGSTQWAVTLMKPLLLELQQSVVDAMKSISDIAFFILVFILSAASSILR